MSCNDENVQKGFLEEWRLDCADYSTKNLKQILKKLQDINLKTLILTQVNRPQRYFWSKENISTLQIIDAIKQNKHIETLELSNDFVKSLSRPLSKQRFFVDATQFSGMSSLRHLILDNQEWDERFMHALLCFLTDANCKIRTLELKYPLSDHEHEQLAACFAEAQSWQTCQGVNFKMERSQSERFLFAAASCP